MSSVSLEIVERDDAGVVTSTFVESGGSRRDGKARVDIIVRLSLWFRDTVKAYFANHY
jgi:hypothetical protein